MSKRYVQQKRERRNLRTKRKREAIHKLYTRARFRVRSGSVLALVVRRMKRGTMAKKTVVTGRLH